MATTTAPQTAGIEDLDPGGLDAEGVLGCVGDAETAERRAGLAKLELGLRWCVPAPGHHRARCGGVG